MSKAQMCATVTFHCALCSHRGFPKFMAEIQGQVSVADINGDGHLDMCAVDFKSNIACFDKDGEDIWDRQISGVAAQVPASHFPVTP